MTGWQANEVPVGGPATGQGMGTIATGVPVTGERRKGGRRREDSWPRPLVSVVIPALNEADNLPHVLPKIPNWVHEIILVDGYSTDDTVAVAQRLRSDLRVVFQQGRGKGAALRTGFAAASGEVIVMLDADGSTDPSEIPAFVGALIAGADFVKGSRFLHGAGTVDMESYRKLGNSAFVWAVRLLYGGRYTDLCYGYNAFWRRVLPLLELDGDGFEIETMMNLRALKAGLKIVEVSSFEARRVNGISRLQTIPDGMRVLRTILRERGTLLSWQARGAQQPTIEAPRSAIFGEAPGPLALANIVRESVELPGPARSELASDVWFQRRVDSVQ